MDISQATVNPAKGSVTVVMGSADAGVDLPTHHLIAPWPADEYSQQIASDTLAGMGWQVVGAGPTTEPNKDADASFVLDVAPAGRAS